MHVLVPCEGLITSSLPQALMMERMLMLLKILPMMMVMVVVMMMMIVMVITSPCKWQETNIRL